MAYNPSMNPRKLETLKEADRNQTVPEEGPSMIQKIKDLLSNLTSSDEPYKPVSTRFRAGSSLGLPTPTSNTPTEQPAAIPEQPAVAPVSPAATPTPTEAQPNVDATKGLLDKLNLIRQTNLKQNAPINLGQIAVEYMGDMGGYKPDTKIFDKLRESAKAPTKLIGDTPSTNKAIDYKVVNGALVKVDKNTGEHEVVYKSPDKTKTSDVEEPKTLDRVNPKMSDEEKIRLQHELKVDAQERKDREKAAQKDKEYQRKELKILDKNEMDLEKKIKQLNEIKELSKTYSNKSKLGFGPIATLKGLTKNLFNDLQTIDSRLKEFGLKQMTEMFAGMSKAVDSDAERRAFEASMPNIELDDKAYFDALDRYITNFESLLNKVKGTKKEISQDTDPVISDFAEKNGRTYEEAKQILLKRGYKKGNQ